jgi:hypothetical protein
MKERAGYVMAALLASSGLVHLALLVVSGASWQGPLALRKPVTFGLSFGLTLATIVWVSGFLKLTARARSVLLAAFTAASALETFLVSLQAWRGVPSHFNVETAFDAAVTRGLAGGGVALVAMVVWMTVAALRANPAVPPSMRIAVRTGFVALCGAMAVGGVMIARGMTLVAGGDAPAAYRTGGVLKPIHAVTMHGVLVLPLLAWLLTFTRWSERRRVHVVTAAAGAYGLLILLVTAANLAEVL